MHCKNSSKLILSIHLVKIHTKNFIKQCSNAGIVTHTCNLGTEEAKAERISQVKAQCRLCRKTLSQKPKRERRKTALFSLCLDCYLIFPTLKIGLTI